MKNDAAADAQAINHCQVDLGGDYICGRKAERVVAPTGLRVCKAHYQQWGRSGQFREIQDGPGRPADPLLAPSHDMSVPALADDDEATASVATNINALCSNLAARLAKLDGHDLSLNAVKTIADVSAKLMHTAQHTANVMAQEAKAERDGEAEERKWRQELAERLGVDVEAATSLDEQIGALCGVESLDDVKDVSTALAKFTAKHRRKAKPAA